MTLCLPLPPPDLRPNSRPHWARKAKATKAAKALARLRTLEAGLPASAPTHYRITYHWPTPRRRWDDDNCIAACKAYLDGICAALRMDDREMTLAGLVHDRSQPGKAGVSVEMWNSQAQPRQ
jgi:hypothetical protein